MEKILNIVAWATIAALFMANGLNQLTHSKNVHELFANMGFPAPGLIVFAIILLEIGGGLMFLAGFNTRRIALTMLGFWIIAIFLIHTDGLFIAALNTLL